MNSVQGRAVDELTGAVIGAAIEVHRHLGPGLLESAYEYCLAKELRDRGIPHRTQVELPVMYKGERLDYCYRMDLVVDDRVIVEAKAVDKLLAVHEAQLLTYLRITGNRVGLLINFQTPVLKDGIKRMVL